MCFMDKNIELHKSKIETIETVFNKEQEPRILIALEFIRNRIEKNLMEDTIKLKTGFRENDEDDEEQY